MLATRERRLERSGCLQEGQEIEPGKHVGGDARDAGASLDEKAPRAPLIAMGEVVKTDRDLDHSLEPLANVARGRSPHGLQDLVHLEEELLVPERHCVLDRPRQRARRSGLLTECRHRPERAGDVVADARGVRCVHREQPPFPRVDQVDRGETGGSGRRGVARARLEPGERPGGVIVLERGDRELGQGVA